MNTKTDIEIIFSSDLHASRAKDFAKTMIFVYFQNNYELLPYEKTDGQIRYQGRNVRCEDLTAYSGLWREYRFTYRGYMRNIRGLDSGHVKEAEDMIGQIVCDGPRFLLRDCSVLQGEDRSAGNFNDFFSMLCLMLVSTIPDIRFEGLCCSANPDHYTKRYLTHVVCDESALTFEHARGDPVSSAFLESWIRSEEDHIFIRKGIEFPYIKVSIITDDREGLERDREISQWIERVNQVYLPGDARMEMVFAEPRYLWSMFADINLRAPSRKVCEKYRDMLIALLKGKDMRPEYSVSWVKTNAAARIFRFLTA